MNMKKLLLIIGMALCAFSVYAQDNIERTDNYPTGYMKAAYPYYFGTIDGVLYVFVGSTPSILVKFPPQDPRESYSIPNTVSRISKGAFKGCRNLKEIIIPVSVFYIGEDAFDDTEIERFVVSGNDISANNHPVESINPGLGADGYYDLSGIPTDVPPSGMGIRVKQGKGTKILTK